jgi:hypothetical protein
VVSSFLEFSYATRELTSAQVSFAFNKGITNISGVITDIAGTPIPCSMAYIYPEWGKAQAIRADSYGNFNFDVIEETTFTLVIVEMHYDRKITVPAMAHNDLTINYKDIATYNPEAPVRWNWPTIEFHV